MSLTSELPAALFGELLHEERQNCAKIEKCLSRSAAVIESLLSSRQQVIEELEVERAEVDGLKMRLRSTEEHSEAAQRNLTAQLDRMAREMDDLKKEAEARRLALLALSTTASARRNSAPEAGTGTKNSPDANFLTTGFHRSRSMSLRGVRRLSRRNSSRNAKNDGSGRGSADNIASNTPSVSSVSEGNNFVGFPTSDGNLPLLLRSGVGPSFSIESIDIFSNSQSNSTGNITHQPPLSRCHSHLATRSPPTAPSTQYHAHTPLRATSSMDMLSFSRRNHALVNHAPSHSAVVRIGAANAGKLTLAELYGIALKMQEAILEEAGELKDEFSIRETLLGEKDRLQKTANYIESATYTSSGNLERAAVNKKEQGTATHASKHHSAGFQDFVLAHFPARNHAANPGEGVWAQHQNVIDDSMEISGKIPDNKHNGKSLLVRTFTQGEPGPHRGSFRLPAIRGKRGLVRTGSIS